MPLPPFSSLANTVQTLISANVFTPKILVQKGWTSPPNLCHGNPICSVMFSVQTVKKEFGGKLCYWNSSSCSGSMKSWLGNWCQKEFGQLTDVCIAITQSSLGIWNTTVSIPQQNSDCMCMRNGLKCPETGKPQIWTNQKLIIRRRMMCSIISTEILKRRIKILEILETVVSSRRLTANLTCLH